MHISLTRDGRSTVGVLARVVLGAGVVATAGAALAKTGSAIQRWWSTPTPASPARQPPLLAAPQRTSVQAPPPRLSPPQPGYQPLAIATLVPSAPPWHPIAAPRVDAQNGRRHFDPQPESGKPATQPTQVSKRESNARREGGSAGRNRFPSPDQPKSGSNDKSKKDDHSTKSNGGNNSKSAPHSSRSSSPSANRPAPPRSSGSSGGGHRGK